MPLIVLFLFFAGGSSISFGADEAENKDIQGPVKGLVTMLDLGADKCIPCKMMAPILKKLKKRYHGKAAIVFIDVWKNRYQAPKYGVKAIPTQIFFDKKGNEVYRHVGFMGEKDITKQLKKMGVD